MKNWQKSSIIATATFGMVLGGLNISPVFAKNLSEAPIIQEYTFSNYKVRENTFSADIEVLKINGLKDKELEKTLNTKFINEGQAIYDEFNKEIDSMKADGIEGHIGVGSDFEIKTDTDDVLSIILTKYTTMGSSSTSFNTYVVDKTNQKIVTLKNLFKDDNYIKTISDNIKEQMRAITKADDSKGFYIDSNDMPETNFEKIKADQNFYINNMGQLVILFDKYEVAPGYMGAPEFVIPTETIQNLLLAKTIVK